MGDSAEHYDRLATGFADVIAAVSDDRWSSPSPCEGWTALDVVGHVVQTQGMFLGLVGRPFDGIPPVASGPGAAWDAARATVLADLNDPGRAGTEFDGFFGRTTFAAAVERFLCFDLVVHRWDLCRATGQDERLDPGDVRWTRTTADGFGEHMRGGKGFGPALDAPEGADEQTRLLAFLGRRAW
ncbi:TIGR03086 family metal-binding protein [Nocardiopsis sp. LOL_012]|uniref:TIGR03086 family metal-binding protein n=1 Tax=Nocardiopsis sp. LOL_012 TaxID=3345409 RepID=UPI003A85E2D1